MHVSILRSLPAPQWRSYDVPYAAGMTVLDVLLFVQQHHDPTLAFRYECRQSICGTCGVMLNRVPVLSCSTQVDPERRITIAPLSNFSVEKDLIVDIAPVLKRFMKVKPYLEKIHAVMLTKTDANKSKPFRKCIECCCCIAGSPTVGKHSDAIFDPMALVKIARYVTDPRDGMNRKVLVRKGDIQKYSMDEGKRLTKICPRGVPIDTAIQLLK